jgi:hypothetical protein
MSNRAFDFSVERRSAYQNYIILCENVLSLWSCQQLL